MQLFNISSVCVFIIMLCNLATTVDGFCFWPAQFQSSQWHDSAHGVLTFGSSLVTGWDFDPSSGQTLSDWECLINTADTDGRIVLGSNSFTLFSSTYYAYLCITVTKVTDASYRYYINQRNEATAKITCPWMFLGRYGYTHTSVAGVTTCDTTTSDWDMCTDNTQMTFNYGTCPTKVAYSNSDTVWCIDNLVVGDTNFLTTYNANDPDSDIDDTTVYKFSFAISSAGDMASVSPQHCQGGQSPGVLPTNNEGTTVGATLTIAAPTETCATTTTPTSTTTTPTTTTTTPTTTTTTPTTTTTTPTTTTATPTTTTTTPTTTTTTPTSSKETTTAATSSNKPGLIGGIVVGTVVLIAAGVLVVYWCFTKQCNKVKPKEKRVIDNEVLKPTINDINGIERPKPTLPNIQYQF